MWLAAKTSNGYGHIKINGKMVGAHRVAWELENGSITDGLDVLHDCDVKLCVNNAHLFLGTQVDNMADRDAKGRQAKGELNGRSKLTADQIREIRESNVEGNVTQQALADCYGVSNQLVSKIVNGERWAHI